MAGKNLLEIFSKYQPSERTAAWMLSSTDIRLRADKERRMIEVSAAFPALVEKRALYAAEAEIAKAYELSHVRILPHYPAELFGKGYISELIEETQRIGIVARGFFNSYRATLENDTLTIEMPYIDESLLLMEAGKTPQVIEGIIRSEFGISVKVQIRHSPELAADYTFGAVQAELAEWDARLKQSVAEYDRAQESRRAAGPSEGASPVPAPSNSDPDATRIMSLLGEAEDAVIEDGICRVGKRAFDISAPQFPIGSAFEIRPVPIARVDKQMRNVVIAGEVFGYTCEANRAGDKFNVNFGLTDGHSSITVKKFSLEAEDAKALGDVVKEGAAIALKGYAKHDVHKDVVDEDVTFYYSDIATIGKVERMDNAPVKRVELHLHTTMSNMDALIPPDVVVKTAKKWGHPAVAITDHGNVQGYQDAMLASEKIGQKVIWGMEAYFVNDTASALNGTYDGSFEDEFVVFDIETTGLSNQSCGITEIGAVKVKNGEVLARYNTFVNPEMPIPEEVVSLTGITDEMVKDARVIADVLPEFFEFVGDRLLIAHNADFDMGFIRVAAKRCDMDYDHHPYLDTVALSRHLNPELKSHKLNKLAEYFKLGDFNHHRASDDAEMLAMIYFKMLEKMQKMELRNFKDLQNEMSASADVLRLPTYHQIILVKNKVGLKNLYKLVSFSYLEHYRKVPRVPKTVLEKHREGLIIGSACEAGELITAMLDNKPEGEIEEIAKFYDYLEIQPISNNRFMIDKGLMPDEEALRNLNRRIVALGDKLGIPVVATCDAHFLNDDDEIFRKVLVSVKFKNEDKDSHLYYRTTEEMLEEFAYLGEEKAYEVVVTNTNAINDQIESDIRPFPKGTFTPNMDGAEEDLQRICYDRAKSMYGDPLPEIVEKRLDKELTSIIKNGFAVLYMIAQKLVWYSESQGYLVGSRGSVGSSFVASMAGISEVNPLPPHYWCPKCQHNEFDVPEGIGSGFDLPDKNCPKCGTKLNNDGHNIPFETFLGFYGDKSPDIDLNFSGEVQGRVHKYTEELFGAENVFRAGTIGGIAEKTAFGFVLKYLEEKKISVPRAEMNRLAKHCEGVKRSTGQHPGGIVVVPKEYEIYDFCPVQHPADDPNSDIVTTHFTFEYLHDTLLKLDELGHDIPTKYKWIERFSDTSVMDVPMNAREVYDLFLSTKPLGISPEDIDANLGTYGLPEFGTRFVMKMVEEAKPRSFADLLQISGLSHGTDVWTNNAQDLIKEGICDISHVIGCRDNIMNDLIRYGVENAHAFKIMESVRKGKGLTPEWEAEMREHNVPEWYIGSCKKIKYMFPKAHAAAYVMSAIRLGWYKVHMPIAFYSAMFTVAPGGFDAAIVMGGKSKVVATLKDIDKRTKDRTASPKEQASVPTLQLINECMARGIRFLPIDIEKSDSKAFLPENGAIRMPFSSLGGVGENAAESIIKARNEEPFFSVEDLQIRAGLNKSVVETLRNAGVLDNINETDQLSMF